MFVGNNVSAHLMRIENSFYRELNEMKYIGLSDLSKDKFGSWKWFNIKPFASEGVLADFHEVFKGMTYFKNPFEACSD